MAIHYPIANLYNYCGDFHQHAFCFIAKQNALTEATPVGDVTPII